MKLKCTTHCTYDEVDAATKNKLEKTYACKIQYILPRVQKQHDLEDCGLFAVAFGTDIAYGKKVGEFDQNRMHHHECFGRECISTFPQ